MKVTIHRRLEQIGGCITEIESASGTRIFIDLRRSLPSVADDKYPKADAAVFVIPRTKITESYAR